MTLSPLWPLLLVLSVLLTGVLQAIHLPAATLLGPMAAAIFMALRLRPPALPAAAPHLAQGLLGLMIAQSLPAAMLPELATRWPLILAGTAATLTLSSLLGWLLSRSPLMPGTTALWGSMPGAASVITLISQDFGADARLVAFMQYLRVALVALSAALMARLAGLHTQAEVGWFPALGLGQLALTLALAAGLAWAGLRLRLPGGAFLAPMLAGLALLHLTPVTFALPPWLMALAYAVIGWTVGLRFTRAALGAALHSFPRVLAAILTLMTACGGLALALHHLAGIDLLTAYLATSPGGADSIAIIATQVSVDVPFVMTMQMTRFLVILFAGPSLARLLSSGQKR
ncbi:AbrB family transcriptional regulator [Rhodobacter sp. KR11]|uniref:AbrB family transcriptional regulator n=1 Tax=Rhodobacter sp. KR11 TaxID=2974588 RepID=UPI002222A699|nr:AbrB family transcriptional regulator [Rhodobacter sp. KR11]MCW1919732.1 AbrB family transcriptional regulator [Rhodobacter sp. KR11]